VAGKQSLLKIGTFEVTTHIELLFVVERRIRPNQVRPGRHLIPELLGDRKGNLFFSFCHP